MGDLWGAMEPAGAVGCALLLSPEQSLPAVAWGAWMFGPSVPP